MKRIALLILIISFSLVLISCGSEASYGILRVDINPSVYLVVDEKEEVLSYTPANDEAKVLLLELDLKGLSSLEAIKQIIEASYELGYIDLFSEDNIIQIFGYHHSDEAFEENVLSNVQQFIEDEGLPVALLKMSELKEETKEELVLSMMVALGLKEDGSLEDQLAQLKEQIEQKNQEYLEMDLSDEINLYDALHAQESFTVTNFFDEIHDSINYEALNQYALENYEDILADIQSRNLSKKAYAEATIHGELASYMVGTYTYEMSVQVLSYFVSFHNIILNANGTYTESYSWTSKETSMTVSSDGSGTWGVDEGQLILTNSSGYQAFYKIAGIRLYKDEFSGNRTYFIKVD